MSHKKIGSKQFLLSLVILLLAGCSFAPKYNRPSMPTAENYPRESGEPGSTNVKEIAWQDFFADQRLREIIDLALQNNRNLQGAMHRMKESWAVYGVQRSDLFPKFDAVSDNLRMRVPSGVLPSPSIPAPSPALPAPTPSPKSSSFILPFYMLSLKVTSWELDFWGRIRNLKDAALEEYLASTEAQRAISISLIDQVANIYLIGCELNELIKIAKETAASRKKSYDLTKERFVEGSASKFDLVQLETLYNGAEVEVTMLERTRELNWNALVNLVGASVEPDNRLLSQIEPCFVQEISSGLPSDLLSNRPDILAAEHRIKAAHFSIGAARAAFFPKISLTGFLGVASAELKNLFRSGTFWAWSPDASQTIFDWGQRIYDLRRAKARRDVIVTDYEQTIQNAFREVADALADRTWYAEQIVYQKDAIKAEEERTQLAWHRYNQGSSSFLEVLDVEREKFAVAQDLVKSRRALLSSNINLYSALGGGVPCK